MKQLLLFDLDDTLIYTHRVFLQVTAEIIDRMEELGIIDDNLYYTLDSFDQELVEEEQSFSMDIFPRAVGKTYDFYCQKLGLEYNEQIANELNEIAWGIKTIRYEAVEGAEKLLSQLYAKGCFQIYIVTRGDEEVQKKKIKDNNFDKYIDGIYVVPNKNTEIYQKIILENGFTKENTWIIGNSLKAEIMPAQQLGIKCILTDVTKENWNYENIPNCKINCPKVNELLDCLNIIK